MNPGPREEGRGSAFTEVLLPPGVSLVAQMVKNLPAMQETHVLSLGWEDRLEKEMVPHPVFLPGESHGQRSLAVYSPWCCRELDTTEYANIICYDTHSEML